MQTKNYIVLLLFCLSITAKADDGLKWSELRVLINTNTLATAPTALNNLTAPDNVPALDTLHSIGIEADAKYKWIKVGTQLRGTLFSLTPPNAALGGNSSLTVQQYAGGVLARIPIIDKDMLQFDVFAELGIANTKIDVQTSSSGKGTFTKDSGFYQRAGASLGLGWATFKFYVEAGQEWNNLNDLSFQGTIANNIKSVDFTGPYYALGIIIYGMPSWIKPGGITVGKN